MSTTSKTAWSKARRHKITLPSAVQVEIELPNLPLMLKTGQIPNDLAEIALKKIQRESIDIELVSKMSDFQRHVVAAMVKDPEISPEDVDQLPAEDIDMLQRLANREIDQDAVGHHLAGLETNDDWRSFREQRFGLEDLASLA